MKKLTYIIATILLLVTGCRKEEAIVMEHLSGDWHYSAETDGVTEDVYITFTEDRLFEMFQKIGEGPYWYSTGEFTLDVAGMELSGIYSDRTPWKYTYRISVTDKTLEMTAEEAVGHTVTYTRESIPEKVRTMSVPLTKASSEAMPFL